jgi:hypothetical protein
VDWIVQHSHQKKHTSTHGAPLEQALARFPTPCTAISCLEHGFFTLSKPTFLEQPKKYRLSLPKENGEDFYPSLFQKTEVLQPLGARSARSTNLKNQPLGTLQF